MSPGIPLQICLYQLFLNFAFFIYIFKLFFCRGRKYFSVEGSVGRGGRIFHDEAREGHDQAKKF